MKIVFWQNVLSIHQEALLVALTEKVEVWLVYEEELYESRKTMGWTAPKFEGVKLLSVDSIKRYEKEFLQEISNDYHVFSGINTYVKISKYFNLFYKKQPERVICFLEKPGGISLGITKYLRQLKYKFYAVKYRKLKLILTPGGEDYLLSAGFSKPKIIPFGYFGPNVGKPAVESTDGTVQFIYVGALSKLKNVSLIINAFKHFQGKSWHLSIVGDGEERSFLENEVNHFGLKKHVTFYGFKSNNEVKQFLEKSDCLILPSLYDGWGYVVNEAMASACLIISSDACGVSSVVRDCVVCEVFESNSIDALKDAIQKVLEQSNNLEDKKRKVLSFFKSNLSGESGAELFYKAIMNNSDRE